MPVQNIGMVFTYNKPKIVSASLATTNASVSNRTLNIGMVQRIKRNTTSMASIMYNINHKCSSCGT